MNILSSLAQNIWEVCYGLVWV